MLSIITPNEWFWLIVAGAAVLLILAPTVLCSLGFSRRKSVCTRSAPGFQTDAKVDEVRLVNELKELGFEPTGLRCESITFLGPHWYLKSDQQHILLSQDRTIAALVYRLYRTLPLEVLLVSRLDNSAVVSTKIVDQKTGEQVSSFAKSDKQELQTLLESHQHQVQQGELNGKSLRGFTTLEEANTIAQDCLDTPSTRTKIRNFGWSTIRSMIAQLVLVCFISALFGPFVVGRMAQLSLALTVSLISGAHVVWLKQFIWRHRRETSEPQSRLLPTA